MTKEEFIKILEQKLTVINDEERADILSEYEQHIQMKIESGLSEEQAIEDFGDMDELVTEILDAYHINTQYGGKGGSFAHQLSYYLRSGANFLTNLSTAIFEKNRHELGQIFIKFLGLCLLLLALRIGVELVLGLFYPLYAIMPDFLHDFLFTLTSLLVNLAFLALTVYLLYYFICRYVLVDYEPLSEPDFDEAVYRENTFSAQESFDTVKKHTVNLTKNIKERLEARENDQAERPRRREYGLTLGEMCLKVIAFFVKCLAVLLLIPGVFTVLGLAIACGVLVVFVFKGFSFIGLFLITLGCVLVSAACCFGIFNFVFGGGAGK